MLVSGSGIAGPYANLHLDPDTTTPASHHSVFYRPDALPAAQPMRHAYVICSSAMKRIQIPKLAYSIGKNIRYLKSYVIKALKKATILLLFLQSPAVQQVMDIPLRNHILYKIKNSKIRTHL